MQLKDNDYDRNEAEFGSPLRKVSRVQERNLVSLYKYEATRRNFAIYDSSPSVSV